MPVVTRGPPTDVGQSSNAPRHPSKDHDARKGDSAGIKATAGVFPNDKRTVSRAWSPGSPRGGGGGHCQLSQQFGRMILTHRLGTEMRTGSASTNRPNYANPPTSCEAVASGSMLKILTQPANVKPYSLNEFSNSLGVVNHRAARLHGAAPSSAPRVSSAEPRNRFKILLLRTS